MTASTEDMDTRLNSPWVLGQPVPIGHEAFRGCARTTDQAGTSRRSRWTPTCRTPRASGRSSNTNTCARSPRNVEVFSSAEGVFIDDFPQLETMLSFIVTDPPRHTELRNIVTVAFTPRNIRKMTDRIAGIVRNRRRRMPPRRGRPLCELITKEVPGQVSAACSASPTETRSSTRWTPPSSSPVGTIRNTPTSVRR